MLFIGLGVLALVILAVIILLITKGSNKPTTSASVDSPTNSQPTPLAVKTKISSTDGMVMVYVPAGEFLMGSKDDVGNGNEHPQHTVSLDAYWIDQTEVTNAMYEKCVTAGVCTDLGSNASNTRKEYFGNAAYADYPVIFVNWYQAQAYCKWAARELPTEAQWEKAARGTDGEAYPWGNETPTKDIANYNANKGDTTKVGSYAAGASPYGAYDMAGNVWEWVADKYDEQYYSSSPASNPTGAASGKYQILRGGSWYNLGTDIRSAYRSGVSPSVFYYDTGFRCALN